MFPGSKLEEIKFAKKVGGTRPQIINNNTRKLELGEAKIVGEKIIFNITPSPGASTCLGNAFEDASKLMEFLGNKYTFNREQFEKDLVLVEKPAGEINLQIQKQQGLYKNNLTFSQ